jgi:methylated-DNA-[protein]-cysteine S-methyltransferase
MPSDFYYSVFKTEAGWVGIIGSANGLRRVCLPQSSEAAARELLINKLEPAILSENFFNDLPERLRQYFSGRRAAFPDRLDFFGATPFQRRVWEAARLIPYGVTRSYQWLAGQTGRPGAARAAGNALGKNPLPIIVPCHRVIASDGGMGGFTGGIEMKKQLLNLESGSTAR